ncbi:MAG: hypothetical protein H6730_02300 [Deltaproteobacteria bacterium]|nr:hypothetical protein [Deltaproteobacteria bacterium]
MLRLAPAVALSLLVLASACRRAESDTATAMSPECVAINDALRPHVQKLEGLQKAQPNTVPEALALMKQVVALVDDALAQLDKIEVSDPVLTSRLKSFKDTFFILRSMGQSVLTNVSAGHIDSVLAQVEEIERFQAQVDAAADALDAYCEP